MVTADFLELDRDMLGYATSAVKSVALIPYLYHVSRTRPSAYGSLRSPIAICST